ncbi:hypothetical protein Misp02_25180 [Microtetraspora sp. NBRC 16547]|nr:hypothetical protein Misp02_25180 [Microtetraspora sp. NBRC 16547]
MISRRAVRVFARVWREYGAGLRGRCAGDGMPGKGFQGREAPGSLPGAMDEAVGQHGQPGLRVGVDRRGAEDVERLTGALDTQCGDSSPWVIMVLRIPQPEHVPISPVR